jgi:hypothetical protein
LRVGFLIPLLSHTHTGTRVLDYFLSAHQKKLAKIFAWETEFKLSPGRNLIKYLRMVQRETGLSYVEERVIILTFSVCGAKY